MACGCQKNRAGAAGANGTPGTYRVMVGDRVVYQSSSQESAAVVASRFDNATILAPGE